LRIGRLDGVVHVGVPGDIRGLVRRRTARKLHVHLDGRTEERRLHEADDVFHVVDIGLFVIGRVGIAGKAVTPCAINRHPVFGAVTAVIDIRRERGAVA